MSAPLSDHWTVEYHFFSDSFSVKPLPDYLSATQRHFHQARFFDGVLLAIHPTHEGARDECNVWQDRRNQSPLTPTQRVEELRRRAAALEGGTEASPPAL